MVALPTAKLVAWADNDALDTTNVNAYLRDPLRFLLAKPIARMRQTAAVTPATSTWTDMTFTTEDIDTDPDGVGGHSTSSNTARFTARYPGWYEFTGNVVFVANSTGYRRARWSQNGTSQDGTQNTVTAQSGVATEVQPVPFLVALGVGEYVTLQGWQSSGAGLATNLGATCSVMQVEWKRAIVGDV